MKSLFAYFRALFRDLLYWRVCVTLFGFPLAGFACYALVHWHPTEPIEWFGMALVVALGAYGAWLTYASTLGSDQGFERATRYIDDGGEFLGIVLIAAVAVLAIPITVAIRLIWPNRSNT